MRTPSRDQKMKLPVRLPRLNAPTARSLPVASRSS